MPAAILDQGRTNLRDALRGVAGNAITNIAIATDATAFAANQTVVDPAAAVGGILIKAASFAVVDLATIDATMTINGTTEFTNKTGFTLSLLKGPLRTDAISRSVRTQGIGVQAGDSLTVGVRYAISDVS